MKYKLTIGGIFKNESDCLEEWIKHHLDRNIEHIYLIDDYSSDNYMDILNPYIKIKQVSIYKNNLKNFHYGRQAELYNFYFKKAIKESEWLGIIDLDEFLWSPYTKKLNLILDNLYKNKIEGIIIWSLIFGGNNIIYQPKKIINSFTKRQNIEKKCKEKNFSKNEAQEYLLKKFYFKQIVHTKNLIKLGIHTHLYKNLKESTLYLNPYEINNNLLRINHYKTQSKQKWIEKMNKPDVNLINPNKLSDIEAFIENTNHNLDIKNIMDANNFANYRKIINIYDLLNSQYNEIEDIGLKNQK
jgi:hypothetical protein